ncbi:MAG: hypothetical protein LCH96_12625 [Actinobacteria bacterium]|nr:hypothetical protein [Actinomycetota bacterium]
MRTRVLTAVAVAVLLTGCTSGGSPVSTPSSARPPFQTTTPLPSPSGSASVEVPPKRWAAILGDLTNRGVPTDAVEVVKAVSVTWPNGALGCPKPGVSYTQALVDGMQVVVSVAGKQYDYRFGNSDQPKLCTGLR